MIFHLNIYECVFLFLFQIPLLIFAQFTSIVNLQKVWILFLMVITGSGSFSLSNNISTFFGVYVVRFNSISNSVRFFALLFFGISFLSFAQKGYLIGNVLDQSSKQGIELASVTNLTSKELTRTNKQGVFFITVSKGDSVEIFSMSHGRTAIQWDGNTEEMTILMKKLDKAIQMQEIKVVSKREQQLKKEIEQILSEPEARKNLSFGEAAALAQSPITLLYELFSKSAREDRKVAMLMQEKRRRELAHYRFGMIAGQATELSGESLEGFRHFCDFSEEFLLLSSDYDLTYEVLQCWNIYKRFKK